MGGRYNRSILKIAFYLLVIPLLVFYGLIFGGCTLATPGANKLGIIELYQDLSATVSIGYFGVCVSSASNATGSVACTTIAFRTLDDVISSLQPQTTFALPEGALKAGISFANLAIFNVLALAFLLFMSFLFVDLALFVSNKRRRKDISDMQKGKLAKRKKRYRDIATLLVWTSSTFAFASAVAATQSTRALQVDLESKISVVPVQLSLGLHWMVVILSVLLGIGWTLLRRPVSQANSGTENAVENGIFGTGGRSTGGGGLGDFLGGGKIVAD